jgi:hypothetical protein
VLNGKPMRLFRYYPYTLRAITMKVWFGVRFALNISARFVQLRVSNAVAVSMHPYFERVRLVQELRKITREHHSMSKV